MVVVALSIELEPVGEQVAVMVTKPSLAPSS